MVFEAIGGRMPGTFSDSWKLTKTSFRLIREDRALLVFPVVGGLAMLAVIVLLLLGEFWLVYPGLGTSSPGPYQALGVGLGLLAYFILAFLSVYATAGLIGAATLKLNGQQPTAADGWRVARGRLARLVLWSLLAATVGLLIQAISSRVRGVGGLLIGLVGGAAWGVVTYFMVPVLLYEDVGTWPSLKRSGQLFISNFGRSAISNLVVGLVVGGGIAGAVILGVVGVFVLATSVALGLVLIGVAIALAVAVALIGAAAEGILRAALYRYATTGKIDPDLLPAAYRPAGTPAPPPPLPG